MVSERLKQRTENSGRREFKILSIKENLSGKIPEEEVFNEQ